MRITRSEHAKYQLGSAPPASFDELRVRSGVTSLAIPATQWRTCWRLIAPMGCPPNVGRMRERSSDAYVSAVLGLRCRVATTCPAQTSSRMSPRVGSGVCPAASKRSTVDRHSRASAFDGNVWECCTPSEVRQKTR